jgi:hypothetical protein
VPGSIFYNVEVKPDRHRGEVLTIQSPHRGYSWVSDASELGHPDRATLLGAETSGNAVTLTLDLADQASFLGHGRFAPDVSIAVVFFNA